MPGLRDALKRLGKSIGAFVQVTTGSSLLAAETSLATTTVPKGVLTETGDYVEIDAHGTTVNNANAKTIKLYWGATVILNLALTVSQAGFWRIKAKVYRTGKDTQRCVVEIMEGLVTLGAGKMAFAENTALAEDEDADITVKITGTAPTADNDMTCKTMAMVPSNITREIQL